MSRNIYYKRNNGIYLTHIYICPGAIIFVLRPVSYDDVQVQDGSI